MRQVLSEIKISTARPIEFIDITGRVREALAASGIRDGSVTVFSRHTTAAVKVNERCERLQQDMEEILKSAVPEGSYRHDEDTVDGRPNARGHLMSLLLSASETVPAQSGELLLGGWQSIFFVELDGPRSERNVVVRIIGE
ncbi:MAG: secondary thiamine-phosphate synthase enzyme YjbQ [bacterium]